MKTFELMPTNKEYDSVSGSVACGIRHLKVLSSEMDPAEIRLIRWDFFKGIVASGF